MNEPTAQLSEPIRLRLFVLDKRLAEQLAYALGDSDTAAVLRRAVRSGLLLEAVSLPPDEEGKCGPLSESVLAKVLRRTLVQALDVMALHEQLPFGIVCRRQETRATAPSQTRSQPSLLPAQRASPELILFETSVADEMEGLGITSVSGR